MKLTVLTDNNTYIDQYYLGEPGLCYYLEDGEERLLFDLGYSDVFVQNANAMGIPLETVRQIVFSHGHNDHTGGMRFLPPEVRGCRIIAHKNVLEPKRENGLLISAPRDAEALASHFSLCLSKEPRQISQHIWFLGQIPRRHPFENQMPIGLRLTENGWEPDFLLDDSALALRFGDGVFIVTGCSHSGICNIVSYAKEVTGCTRVLGLIGGCHLFETDAEQTEQTAAFLAQEQMTEVFPCHCTSLQAKLRLSQWLNLREVGVGLQLEWDEKGNLIRESHAGHSS